MTERTLSHYRIVEKIGQGGMGPKTLQACKEVPGVYLHAIGGAAAIIARNPPKARTRPRSRSGGALMSRASP